MSHRPSKPSDGGASAPTHVFLIILDDVGYADTTVTSSSKVVGWSTPNMERQARTDGVLLSNYYTQTVCSPSRSSFLTGKFPFNTGMQHEATIMPGSHAHLPLEVPTLAELLKNSLNYETHAIGKWHLGYASAEYTPTGRGFDSFFGYLQGQIDYWNKSVVGNGANAGLDFWDVDARTNRNYQKPAWGAVGNYSLNQYMERFTRVVTRYAETHPDEDERSRHPLFVYFAHQSIHIPLQSAKKDDSRCNNNYGFDFSAEMNANLGGGAGGGGDGGSRERGAIGSKKMSDVRRRYCRMTVELDDAMGAIEKLLKDKALWDESIIVVSSDNGGMVAWTAKSTDFPLKDLDPPFPGSVGSNYPLRGSKTTLYEGGVRSLAYVTGGKVSKENRGKPYAALAHAVDLPAFIIRAANGAELLRDFRMDGYPLNGLKLRNAGPDQPSGLETRWSEMGVRTDVPINVINGGKDYTAIRFGKWKLIVGRSSIGGGFVEGWWPPSGVDPPVFDPKRDDSTKQHRSVLEVLLNRPSHLLFDLQADPLERLNLARNRTDVVKQGRRLLQRYLDAETYQEPQTNRPDPRAFPQFHGGAWKPFLRRDEGGSVIGSDMDMEAVVVARVV